MTPSIPFRVSGTELILFWKNVTMLDNGCNIWNGRVGAHGYGVFSYRGQEMLAHRFSLKVSLGRDIAPGMWAMHDETCSKLCIRHLTEGSPSENAKSAWAAGKTNLPKLSKSEMEGLAWLVSKGVPMKIATRAYGVARSYVSDRKYKQSCRAAA